MAFSMILMADDKLNEISELDDLFKILNLYEIYIKIN